MVTSKKKGRAPLLRTRSKRTSLIPARARRPAAGQPDGPEAEDVEITGEPAVVIPATDEPPDIDGDTQLSLPSFGEDGQPLPRDVTDEGPADSSAGLEQLTGEETDVSVEDDAVDEEGHGPEVSVDGAYSIPPESVTEFAQLIEEEEQAAEEAVARGDLPISDPPASVEDYLKDGYFEAVRAEADDQKRAPSSLKAMFDEMDHQDKSWWSEDEAAAAAEAKKLARDIAKPFPPPPPEAKPPKRKKAKPPPRAKKKPPTRKRQHSVPPPLPNDHAREEEAAKELLRASGRVVGETEPEAYEADADAEAAAEAEPAAEARPAADEKPASRLPLYVMGILVAAGIGFYLERASRTPAESTAPTPTVVKTVVVRETVVSPGGDGEHAGGAAPTETSEPSAPPGWQPGGQPWAGAGAGASFQPGVPGAGGAPAPEASGAATAEPDATGEPYAEDTAEPASEAAPFDRNAARQALQQAAGAASGCPKGNEQGSTTTTVSVTFAPSGRVTTAVLTSGPFVGTATGSCIAQAFRSARVPPFEGSFVTVSKTVRVR